MLQGKNCVVTAATAGIGKAIAKQFLEQGGFVFITGRSSESVNGTIAYFHSFGLMNVQGIISDASTPEGCNKIFEEVEATGKFVDVLVNNLGMFDSGNFFDYTDDKWLEFFNTNVMSTVRMCRQYLKQMLQRDQGRIIIISSECGVRPIGDMIPYSMTKAAQINIARGLAELTKGTKVTVNSLLPGPTATESVLGSFIEGLVAQGFGSSKEEAVANYFTSREPTSLLQRFLTVDEVANVATFLASDLSSGINGATQLVEGGIVRRT